MSGRNPPLCRHGGSIGNLETFTLGREFESRCRHTNWDFSHKKKKGNGQKVGIPTPFSDKVGGGKMQTSSPPVITPNRSQSNPDDMITLPRPIQSVGMDLHDVSGTSTGQTLPRERRAPPGTHFCPTIWWVYPHAATIFILHPLLSTFSSTFVRNIKQQPQDPKRQAS